MGNELELREKVERMDWRTVLRQTGELAPEVESALNEYFRHFIQPPILPGGDGKVIVGRQKCPGCVEFMFGGLGGDDLVGAMFASFRWGIIHGEGACARCGWPARVHHTVYEGEEELFRLRNFGLIYHLDNVAKQSAHEANDD